ncbi:hypothetical protein RHDC4_02979 [Rhodocyclaceae bacterium]|nr:hypothetical protein RHDC4_02979 [Rhodocyclaceae bacterium]
MNSKPAADSLETRLPEGQVVDAAWLAGQGLSRSRVDAFLRAGRLVAVGRGGYRRPGPPLKWEHVVYSLAALGYPVYVGGRSALELGGHAHYLPLAGVPRVELRGARRLPVWAQAASPVELRLHARSLFRELPAQGMTTRAFGHWDWPIPFATPELALLEVAAGVESDADFDFADKFFESATVLRPALVAELLRACTQVRAKRMFLWFAARHGWPWFAKLDLAGVDLGRGKRMVAQGGVLDRRFQITVPKRMASDAEQPVY